MQAHTWFVGNNTDQSLDRWPVETCMSILLIVGPKCMLAASHTALGESQ